MPTEEKNLSELAALQICPQCGKSLEEKFKYGTGRLIDGVFCSLDCFSEYHKLGIMERAKRVQELFHRVANN
ncbi:MAG: hypothetical protein R3E39_26505 [Anaerolineae bacterium]